MLRPWAAGAFDGVAHIPAAVVHDPCNAGAPQGRLSHRAAGAPPPPGAAPRGGGGGGGVRRGGGGSAGLVAALRQATAATAATAFRAAESAGSFRWRSWATRPRTRR